MVLNKNQQEIYSRQVIMNDIGEEGQQKLLKSSVLVVGCGGLGAPVLFYLTAAGIGHIGLCDGDKVALSNLNRQILFTSVDIDKPKASTAGMRLQELNPEIKTTVYDTFMDAQLADEIIPSYDIVVDCLDNFETRFILNDACVKAKKPFIHAGVGEFYGQLMTITPGKGPCLRCQFPSGLSDKIKQGDGSSAWFVTNREDKSSIVKNQAEEPSPCLITGVIGATPGVIGSMQAMEAVKCLLGLQVCNDGLVIYNGLEQSLEKVVIEVNKNCICNR